MFKAKMADAKMLKDMMGAISILVDEATFDLSAEGIKLRAMDPSRVAMVDFEWPKTVFDEYSCTETAKMCINISELLKLLRRTGKDESVELSLDEKTGKLKISIKGRYSRTFNMPTLEAMDEEVPTPKVNFNVKAKTTTQGLREAIEDASLVSDHVKISADSNKLVMNASGDIMGATIDSKATFSLSYLSEILKASLSTSEIVVIEFSTDMPIKLDFKQEKDGKLKFYLAPRIEVE